MPSATLARMGFNLRIERFLGDVEISDADRSDARRAPYEQGEVRLHRKNLDGPEEGQRLIGDERLAGGIDQQLQGRELRLDAEGERRGICDGEHVGGVDFDRAFDGLDGRSLETEYFGAIRLVADALRLQAARDFVGVVLKRDNQRSLFGRMCVRRFWNGGFGRPRRGRRPRGPRRRRRARFWRRRQPDVRIDRDNRAFEQAGPDVGRLNLLSGK